MQVYAISFAVALLASWILVPYVKRWAQTLGAMDAPDARKVHKSPIPRMGGLAIYLGFIIAVVATMHLTFEMVGMLIGATIIVAVGIADDIYQLDAKVKLLGQILAAAVLVMFDVRIAWIINPFGDYIYLEYLSIPFTIFWVVSLTNVVNLIDGLDGLAAGVSIIASATVILVALKQGFYPVAILTAAVAGSTLGFIKYNFNPAVIFMGDTGSMFLGYILAAISIFGAVKTATTIALLVPAIALGLPIMDTAFAIMRRYSNGKPIFQPDKGHFHHRLLAMGFTQKQAVLLMYCISAVLGLSAILLSEATFTMAAVIIGVIIAGVFIVAKKIGILNDTESIKTH